MRIAAKGFTLIELVSVMAIIGLLAAIAVARFVNQMNDKAIEQAVKGLSAAATAGSTANYMAKKAGAPALNFTGTNVCATWKVAQILSPQVFPTDLYNTRAAPGAGPDDCVGTAESVQCLIQTNTAPWMSAQFTFYCVR